MLCKQCTLPVSHFDQRHPVNISGESLKIEILCNRLMCWGVGDCCSRLKIRWKLFAVKLGVVVLPWNSLWVQQSLSYYIGLCLCVCQSTKMNNMILEMLFLDYVFWNQEQNFDVFVIYQTHKTCSLCSVFSYHTEDAVCGFVLTLRSNTIPDD